MRSLSGGMLSTEPGVFLSIIDDDVKNPEAKVDKPISWMKESKSSKSLTGDVQELRENSSYKNTATPLRCA